MKCSIEARPVEKPFTEEELAELEKRSSEASESCIVPRLTYTARRAHNQVRLIKNLHECFVEAMNMLLDDVSLENVPERWIAVSADARAAYKEHGCA